MASQQRLEDPVGRAGLLWGPLADLLAGRHGDLRVGLLADLEFHTFVDVARGCAVFGKVHTRRRLRPFSERHERRTCKGVRIRQLTMPGEGRKAQPDLEDGDQAYNSVTLSYLDCLLSVWNPGPGARDLPEERL